jgi:hypothetical protein
MVFLTRNEEDKEGDVVVSLLHMQVLSEPLDARIAYQISHCSIHTFSSRHTNVGSIQKGEEEEHEERGQNTKIAFSQELLLCDWIDMGARGVIDDFELFVWKTGGRLLFVHGDCGTGTRPRDILCGMLADDCIFIPRSMQ